MFSVSLFCVNFVVFIANGFFTCDNTKNRQPQRKGEDDHEGKKDQYHK